MIEKQGLVQKSSYGISTTNADDSHELKRENDYIQQFVVKIAALSHCLRYIK